MTKYILLIEEEKLDLKKRQLAKCKTAPQGMGRRRQTSEDTHLQGRRVNKDNFVKLDMVVMSYGLPLWPQTYPTLVANGSELLHIACTRVRGHIDTLIK